MEVGNLLGQKLQCEGHEKHFLDCQSNYKDISGHNLVRIKSNELGTKGYSRNQISNDVGKLHMYSEFLMLLLPTTIA